MKIFICFLTFILAATLLVSQVSAKEKSKKKIIPKSEKTEQLALNEKELLPLIEIIQTIFNGASFDATNVENASFKIKPTGASFSIGF